MIELNLKSKLKKKMKRVWLNMGHKKDIKKGIKK